MLIFKCLKDILIIVNTVKCLKMFITMGRNVSLNLYNILAKEQRNILHEISKWKANWIGHILRRNSLLQQFIEGKIKGGI